MCSETEYRVENPDEQDRNILLGDEFRGQRVRIALRKDGLLDTGKCI